MTCRKNSEELKELAQADLPMPEGIVEFCLNEMSVLKSAYGGKVKDRKEWYFKCSECGDITHRVERYTNGEQVHCSSCGKELKFVKTDVNSSNDYLELSYDVIQNYKGKLLSRTFKCQKRISSRIDRYKFDIREVKRVIEGNTYCLMDFSGDRFIWNDSTDTPIHILLNRKFKEMKRGKYCQNYFYEPFQGYNRAVLESVGLKYCQYDEYIKQRNMSIIDYVNLYRDRPKIELLVKAGYHSMVASARYLNLKGKNFEQIFGISRYWEPYVKQWRISIIDIRHIKKYSISTYEQLKGIRVVEVKYGFLPDEIKKQKKFCEHVYRKGTNHSLYADYLRWCVELGYPLYDTRILYPKDLHKAHDEVFEEHKKNEKKILQKGFDEFYQKLKKYIYQDDKFVIKPAKSQQELINESETLHHCVRSYAERMSRKETAIFFIREKDHEERPLYTLELRRRQVIQVRGKNNCQLDPEAQDFVKKWEKRYKLSGY